MLGTMEELIQRPPRSWPWPRSASAARAERDWATADELKARIEAAGWRVVDDGAAYALAHAPAARLVEDGQILYGAVESVPSRLESAGGRRGQLVVIAEARRVPCRRRPARRWRLHRPERTQVLVVADRRPRRRRTGRRGRAHGASRFSAGDALQAALRTRHRRRSSWCWSRSAVPSGDIVGPLRRGAGRPFGRRGRHRGPALGRSASLRAGGVGDVTTAAVRLLRVPAGDAIARGPIDGRLQLRGSVAAWLGPAPARRGRRHPAATRPRHRAARSTGATMTRDLPDDHARLRAATATASPNASVGARWLASRGASSKGGS